MEEFVVLFGLLFLVIVVVSFFVKLLKQPIIVAYVLSGLLFSIYGAKYALEPEYLLTLAELGITFLLFLMGLEFDLKSLKYLGKDVLLGTFLQSALFFGLSYIVSTIIGFSRIESIYIGLLFMFSSTLLVAKWLEDKKESGTLMGKLTLSMLIIEDVIAIMALTALSVLEEHSINAILLAPLKGLLFIALTFLVSRYVLNRLFKFASRYPEFLFILSLGVCFFFVEVAPLLGYSTTIGAFLGGIAIANTIYKNEVTVRLKPLIVFFNMLFFVGLGFKMNAGFSPRAVTSIFLLTALCMLVKPMITYFNLRLKKYDSKTSLGAGIHLAQLSEFGIIIMAGGVASEVIPADMGVIAIGSTMLTMILSSYLIKYEKKISSLLRPLTIRVDRLLTTKEVQLGTHHHSYSVIFFGYYDVSKDLFHRLESQGKSIVVVENDPEIIEHLKKEKINFIYSSVHNPDFFEHLNLKDAELVVSNLTALEENKIIIKHLKEQNPGAVAIVTAKHSHDALELYDEGADYVIYTSYLNEQHVSVLLEEYTTDINTVINKKIADITRFKEKEARKRAYRNQTLVSDIDAFVRRLTGGKT